MTTGKEWPDVFSMLGTNTVFGIPGTQNIVLFEALRRSSLKTVLAAGEQGAAFMAIGYYRATGKAGIVATAPGPGVLLALDGIAEAMADSCAVVLLGVRDPSAKRYAYGTKGLNDWDVLGQFVKQRFRAEAAEGLVETAAAAYMAAMSGEPGPVYLEMDCAVLRDMLGQQRQDLYDFEHVAFHPPVQTRDCDAVVDILRARSRPLIIAGMGAKDGAELLPSFAEHLGAPVLTTTSGRGVVADSHRLCVCGDYPRLPEAPIGELIDEADTVLAIGVNFSHNSSLAGRLKVPEQKLVQVDTATRLNGARLPNLLTVRGGSRDFLVRMMAQRPRLPCSSWSATEIAGWKDRFEQSAATNLKPVKIETAGGKQLLSTILNELTQRLGSDGCLVADAGTHQDYVRAWTTTSTARGLLIPSNFQSMGFALPVAIGAKLAAPSRQVVAVVGDGSVAISGMELATAAREQISLTIVVVNDGALGKIQRLQISNYGFESAVNVGSIRLDAFAVSVGANYFHLNSYEDPPACLDAVFDSPGLNLVEITVDLPLHLQAKKTGMIVRQAAKNALGRRLIASFRNLITPFTGS